jgi:succinyl-diaminopimelate desuccinylase
MAAERPLAERLISYDTSRAEGIVAAAAWLKGWLHAREIAVSERVHGGLPVIVAELGGRGGPHVILHGHLDVVPGRPEQFEPRVEGDRLTGRGAYDMKGGLAAMLCALEDVAGQDRCHVTFVCAPDEESEEVDSRATDELVSGGLRGDFAITGEPTDLHIGVQAKGVLMMRVEVAGRAAHGSTPWLGDNAVLKAIDVFRRIETLPFARESSELFDRPSINLGRIQGGDAVNMVPDGCRLSVDIRYLPGQDPAEILAQVRAMPDVEVVRTFIRPPAIVSRDNPFVRALRAAVARTVQGEAMRVGRDGASDAISFLAAGIPAVEFGPRGGGHHGPDEWVSIASLARYRRALADFIIGLPSWLAQEEGAAGHDLRAIDGGLV